MLGSWLGELLLSRVAALLSDWEGWFDRRSRGFCGIGAGVLVSSMFSDRFIRGGYVWSIGWLAYLMVARDSASLEVGV